MQDNCSQGDAGSTGGSGPNLAHKSSSSWSPPNEKAFLARIWGDFDTRYMKPLLTHSRPTLLETLPVCCTPLARILTTAQQLSQVINKLVNDTEVSFFFFRIDLLKKKKLIILLNLNFRRI